MKAGLYMCTAYQQDATTAAVGGTVHCFVSLHCASHVGRTKVQSLQA